MIYKVVLSQTAVDGLATLREWIAGEAGVDVADGYIRRIAAKFATLETFPERGSAKPEVGQGIRSLSFERRRIVFYRITGAIVLIERVIDSRRDLPSTF